MAALCLPSAFADLNATKDCDHPLIMRQPQKASLIRTAECPGTIIFSQLLNKAFVETFWGALSQYVSGCRGRGDRTRKTRGIELPVRKEQVIMFNATRTDENKRYAQ